MTARGRPNLTAGEETEKMTLRLAASTYDELVTAAEELDVTYAGRPAPGVLARKIVEAFLVKRRAR